MHQAIDFGLTDNPLNYERLPDSAWNLELGYRPAQAPAALRKAQFTGSLIIFPLIALALTVAVHMLGWWFLTGWGLTVLAILAVPLALFVAIKTRSLGRGFVTLIATPFTAVFFALVHWATQSAIIQVALVLVAAIILAIVTDRIANDFVRWLLANPWIPEEVRRDWLAHWSARFKSEPSDLNHRLYAFRLYRPLLAAPFVLLPLFVLIPLGPATLRVLAFLLLLVLVAPLATGRSPVAALRGAIRAIEHWLTYGHVTTRAPGMFTSPGGSAGRRSGWFFGAVVLLALAVLPATSYLPVGYELWPSDGWSDVFSRAFDAKQGYPEAQGFSGDATFGVGALLAGFEVHPGPTQEELRRRVDREVDSRSWFDPVPR